MPSYFKKVAIPGRSSEELYQKVIGELPKILEEIPFGKTVVEKDFLKKWIRIQGPAFSAELTCREAEMELHTQLGLLASPFRSKLDALVTTWIEKSFLNKNV